MRMREMRRRVYERIIDYSENEVKAPEGYLMRRFIHVFSEDLEEFVMVNGIVS